jgi:hypothetical protein
MESENCSFIDEVTLGAKVDGRWSMVDGRWSMVDNCVEANKRGAKQYDSQQNLPCSRDYFQSLSIGDFHLISRTTMLRVQPATTQK